MDDEIAGCSWRWHFSLRTWTWTSVKGISTPVGHHHIIHHRSGTLNLTLRVEVLCLQHIATQKPDHVGSPLRTAVAVSHPSLAPPRDPGCVSRVFHQPRDRGKNNTTERPGGQTWPDPFFSSLNWWVGGMMGMFCLTKSIAWIIVFFLGSWCWRCFLEELHGMNWVTVALLVYRCMCVWLFICFFVWLFVWLVGWFIFLDVVPCTFWFPQKDTCLQWCLFGPQKAASKPLHFAQQTLQESVCCL